MTEIWAETAARINQLEADLADMKAGADFTPTDPAATRTPGQLWAYLLSLEPTERIRVLGWMTASGERAGDCFTMDHPGQIEGLRRSLADERREQRNLRDEAEAAERVRRALIAERDHAVALADRYRTSIETAIQQLQDGAYTDLPIRPTCNIVAGSKMTDACACGHMVAAHRRNFLPYRDRTGVLPGATVCELCPRPE
jgi:hypothetical protein